jgi:hypothetical protein
VIVQNMPGAASAKAVQYLDTNAPKDGTVLATFNPDIITQSLLEPDQFLTTGHTTMQPTGSSSSTGAPAHPALDKPWVTPLQKPLYFGRWAMHHSSLARSLTPAADSRCRI